MQSAQRKQTLTDYDLVRAEVREPSLRLPLPLAGEGKRGITALDAPRPVARAGWCGVDLFFVLSGFLVGGMMLEDAARPEGLRLGRFFSRRW